MAELEYAKETIGSYDKVSFFNPYKSESLIKDIEKYLNNELKFEQTSIGKIQKPFTRNWKELFEVLLEE